MCFDVRMHFYVSVPLSQQKFAVVFRAVPSLLLLQRQCGGCAETTGFLSASGGRFSSALVSSAEMVSSVCVAGRKAGIRNERFPYVFKLLIFPF